MHASSQAAVAALGGLVLGVALSYLLGFGGSDDEESNKFSIANQPERHALALKNNNMRVIDIDLCYDPSYAKGKTVLITGKMGCTFSRKRICPEFFVEVA